MRTPAGKECKYFYGDYYRGRNHEECRLPDTGAGLTQWTADLCKTCPVPDILAANSCPHLVMEGEIFRQYILFGRRVRVNAFCKKVNLPVSEPHIGCGECHPLPAIFELDEKDL